MKMPGEKPVVASNRPGPIRKLDSGRVAGGIRDFMSRTFAARLWAHAAGLLALIAIAGCVAHPRGAGPDRWHAWQQKRLESVAGTNGWTTLAGLHWLAEGANPVGSDPTNAVVLPAGRAPARVGTLIRTGRSVRFVPAIEGVVAAESPVAGPLDLRSDALEAPTILRVGGVSFLVIERGERLGVRVRDPESPARSAFQGIRCFPYDPAWCLAGWYEAFPAARTMRVTDVTGGIQELEAPGEFVFRLGGAEHRLIAVQEKGERELFVIFRDRTAGESTYGAGRYLYVAKPEPGDAAILDFNRAYSPPCAFTPYATCPLPPRGNWLPFAIRAGERKPPGHGHP